MEKEVDKVNRFLPSSDGEVMETMHTIMHLFRASQFRGLRAEAGPDGDISHMETKALGYFARRPGATQRDLVQHSGRDKAQVARLVQGLREKELLEARQDEADRRSTRLFLTGRGAKVFENLHGQGQQLAARALAGLSVEERAQLGALLARVRDTLGQD